MKQAFSSLGFSKSKIKRCVDELSVEMGVPKEKVVSALDEWVKEHPCLLQKMTLVASEDPDGAVSNLLDLFDMLGVETVVKPYENMKVTKKTVLIVSGDSSFLSLEEARTALKTIAVFESSLLEEWKERTELLL